MQVVCNKEPSWLRHCVVSRPRVGRARNRGTSPGPPAVGSTQPFIQWVLGALRAAGSAGALHTPLLRDVYVCVEVFLSGKGGTIPTAFCCTLSKRVDVVVTRGVLDS